VGALQLRGDPQHGEQKPQVGGDRRLKQDFAADQVLDLLVEGVESPVSLCQLPSHVGGAGQQRLSHRGQVFADHGE
jgi:hypothetical protein